MIRLSVMRRQRPVVLDAYFRLTERGTSIRTEVLAGLTTFLTLAYILFVNPSILAAAGMDQNAVFLATCLAAVFGTAVMGLYANYPIALAPGMGLNAYFAFVVVGGLGFPWEVALGAVFCSCWQWCSRRSPRRFQTTPPRRTLVARRGDVH